MLYINSENTDPYFNHALEEYFLKNIDEECFILWRNSPCILLGKNQNAYNEINIEYVSEHSLPVVRRISGGGAVFNDLGNINFGFITNSGGNLLSSFERFTAPIIQALKELGVNALLFGRNDITVDGKKISGNAQARHQNRTLHHGTLLFSACITDLSAALKVSPIKLQGKGIKSVYSRVTNISEYLNHPMSVTEFKDYLMNYVMAEGNSSEPYTLSPKDMTEVNRLAAEKYASWSWNFGVSPAYEVVLQKKFKGGIVEVNLNINHGLINDVRIFGDFFGQEDISLIENALKGVRYVREDVSEKLSQYDMDIFMSDITSDDLLGVMFA
jgi:lipoate-protein ligase A